MNTTLRMSIEIMVVRMVSKLPKRICDLSVVKFDCMHEGIRPLVDESKVVVVGKKEEDNQKKCDIKQVFLVGGGNMLNRTAWVNKL